MAFPALEPEAPPRQPGGDIRRHHGALQQQGGGAAHGVEQSPAPGGDSRPVRPQQDGGSQVFLQRRGAGLQPIAPLVQAATGKIQRQHGLAAGQANIEADIGILPGHRGAPAIAGHEPVDDGVLAALGAELGIADLAVFTGEIDGEALLGPEQLPPLHLLELAVQDIRIPGLQARDGPQDAVYQARPEAGAIADRQGTGKVDTRHGLPGRRGAQGFQFRQQQRLQALGAGPKPLVRGELIACHKAL